MRAGELDRLHPRRASGWRLTSRRWSTRGVVPMFLSSLKERVLSTPFLGLALLFDSFFERFWV